MNWESKVLQSCGTKASASKFSTVGVARVVCKLKQYRIEAFIELFFVINDIGIALARIVFTEYMQFSQLHRLLWNTPRVNHLGSHG